MNAQMSKETLNLTKALKGDSKMQGNWGELVLERVLEKSGLEKGREYEVQQSFTNNEGSRVFPDVVINFPAFYYRLLKLLSGLRFLCSFEHSSRLNL